MSPRWICISILSVLSVLLACGSSETGTETDANKPLADGQCRVENDCSDFESCVSPGTVTVCGGAGCPDNECNADFDCVNNGLPAA